MKVLAGVFLIGLMALRGQGFEVAEASIADAQRAMAEGRVTSAGLVRAYLARIAAFDGRLNAVITLNPKAAAEAEALDKERAAKGPRGPLHGIPVIVKDNYSTAGLQTTAGTMALLGFVPSRDAFQVKKLREAGAVILGKSNLHELASGITTVGSAFGQTLNPYDPTRNPGGSSGGTGAAVAASLAAVGMGSDTCGSIRIPASVNNLVGLRPTKGFSSIAGIVPLSVTQDTGGPLARTLADLAAVLDATIGEDPDDAATRLPAGVVRPSFTAALRTGALQAARIGVLEPLFGDASDDAEVLRLVRAAIEELKKQGAVVVQVPMPELLAALEASSVINTEFKEDLAQYLAGYGNPPVHSLQEIVDGGLIHAALAPVFALRVASKGRDSHEYRLAMAKRTAVKEMMLRLLEEQKLDALAYPTMRRKPAKVGEPQGGSSCQLSATTGFPAITVPAGFTADGLPVGLELLGRAWDDARLVSFAYGYEQATHHRRAPMRTPAVSQVGVKSWQTPVGPGVVAQFRLDPATGELGYVLTGSAAVLAATMHRGEKGPVFAVLANHGFARLEGKVMLSDPDRERLFAGGLYLRITLPGEVLRAVVRP